MKTRPIRERPGSFLEKRIPAIGGIGSGAAAGVIGAGVLTVLDDTVGVPFGASVDVMDVEETSEGYLYTVNVNAPTENIAEARAFIDSGTGFTSYLTEEYNVRDVELQGVRVFRDTYQFEMEVIV